MIGKEDAKLIEIMAYATVKKLQGKQVLCMYTSAYLIVSPRSSRLTLAAMRVMSVCTQPSSASGSAPFACRLASERNSSDE